MTLFNLLISNNSFTYKMLSILSYLYNNYFEYYTNNQLIY